MIISLSLLQKSLAIDRSDSAGVLGLFEYVYEIVELHKDFSVIICLRDNKTGEPI